MKFCGVLAGFSSFKFIKAYGIIAFKIVDLIINVPEIVFKIRLG